MRYRLVAREGASRPMMFAAPFIALGLTCVTSLVLFAALGKTAGGGCMRCC